MLEEKGSRGLLQCDKSGDNTRRLSGKGLECVRTNNVAKIFTQNRKAPFVCLSASGGLNTGVGSTEGRSEGLFEYVHLLSEITRGVLVAESLTNTFDE